jgi:hypothetical protein
VLLVAGSVPGVSCGKTFCSTRGTPYYRLQHRRTTFDEVAALRVEGVSIAAIARVKGIAWNTVARWLERAAYLLRRTLCHARSKERLEEHLELLRCYYNFIRPHRALKFGHETRTPAMQAGLTARPLTFGDVFLSKGSLASSEANPLVFVSPASGTLVRVTTAALPQAA